MMADISDVLAALCSKIGETATDGTHIGGYPVRIYGGWPKAGQLDLDLVGKMLDAQGKPVANGIGPIVNVSVFNRPSVERNTTRKLGREWYPITRNLPALTLHVAGPVVTIGGDVTGRDLVAIKSGAGNAVVEASFSLSTSDIAQALARQIPGAIADGSAITLPTDLIEVRLGTRQTVAQEVRRQQRSVQITVWAHNDTARTAVSRVIDGALSSIDRLTLVDQDAWISYQGSNDSDTSEIENLYRRDIFYWIEYATTIMQEVTPVMLFDIASEIVSPLGAGTGEITAIKG